MQQMMEGRRKGSSAPTKWSSNTSMALPRLSNSEMWLQDRDHGGQDLPAESWCQLLLGGFVGEELDQKNKHDCGADQSLLNEQVVCRHHQVQGGHGSSSWTQNNVLQVSSPRSCVTTSLSPNSMLDFAAKPGHKLADHNNSSEYVIIKGNSTETASALKRTRVQGSPSPKFSTLKVRKEKLGDRITALHQLVSPFGKTDTASVLQEAIGYIRFLQSQIEALSSPYLHQQKQAVRQQQQRPLFNVQNSRSKSKSRHDLGKDADGEEDEINEDLRSRGLCLVPVSFTMHVGGDNGADFWAPALGGEL
ncbi:transcription factor bHLH68-like isoform X1 [Zingiber officinale]|uniref:transcription factor bHLH68-like isoform X1 n=1 Tax=Zingiber officinale TaxID=94328 RepID=UPI001C4DC322|nr:transcription factor bHLH68-like isoform X1 [Zingiber officinale]